jgi:esterase/lipase superfamily enzyme
MTVIRKLVDLLEVSEELQDRLGANWPQWRDRWAELLVRLDDDRGVESLVRDVELFWSELAAAVGEDYLNELTHEAAPHQALFRIGDTADKDFPGIGDAVPERQVAAVAVSVFYGTDRTRADDVSFDRRYGNDRGDGRLCLGVADVSVPLTHRVGALEGPRLWRLEWRTDLSRHVAVTGASDMSRDAFATALRATLSSADERDVLLFVHGYNVTFSDALRRAGQLARDLKFPGCVAVFSWPSSGSVLGYVRDTGNAEWAVAHFLEFLGILLEDVGARHVHLLAHSMGNRVLISALERFTPIASATTVGHVVFAAPDVDADMFVRMTRAASAVARRLTLYLSANDLPLKLSQRLYGHARGGGELVVTEGVDTIDASLVDTSLFALRHSYYGSTRSMLSDLHSLFSTGFPPSRRFDLEPAATAAGAYWIYRQ